jgi:hypothetical protein
MTIASLFNRIESRDYVSRLNENGSRCLHWSIIDQPVFQELLDSMKDERVRELVRDRGVWLLKSPATAKKEFILDAAEATYLTALKMWADSHAIRLAQAVHDCASGWLMWAPDIAASVLQEDGANGAAVTGAKPAMACAT